MSDINNIIRQCENYGYDPTDRLSLVYHTFAALKLSNDKTLIDKLIDRNNLHLNNTNIKGSYIYFKKWSEILNNGVEATIGKCLERSDDGQVMRSCSPIVAIITQEERQEISSVWKFMLEKQSFPSERKPCNESGDAKAIKWRQP